jgi:hypothetical protein
MTSTLSTIIGKDTKFSSLHQYPNIFFPRQIAYDGSSRLFIACAPDSGGTSTTVLAYNIANPPANNSTLTPIMTTNDGEFVNSMAITGTGALQYLYITTIRSAGSTTPNSSLYKISTSSPYTGTQISFPDFPANTTIEYPYYITTDSSGNLYNIDYRPTNGNITKLSTAGVFTYITTGGTFSEGGPYSMVINSDGTAIYVIGNNKVHKVIVSSGTVTTLATDSRIGNSSSAFLNNNFTYVIFGSTSGVSELGRVFSFKISDNSIAAIAGNTSGTAITNGTPTVQGSFSALGGICQDTSNNLYACDYISVPYATSLGNDSFASYGYIRLLTTFDPATAPCFKEGTKILTDKGYVPVEDLRKGDMVKTVKNGFVPIYEVGVDTINHQCCEERADHQLYVCKSQNYPELLEDLVITGFHSLLVEDFANEEQKEETRLMLSGLPKSDGYYLLPSRVDKRSEVFGEKGIFKVYHIALEDEDEFVNHGIYANGLLVESISKDALIKNSEMKLLQ